MQASCVNEKNVLYCLEGCRSSIFVLFQSSALYLLRCDSLILCSLACCYATGCFLGVRHSSRRIQMSVVCSYGHARYSTAEFSPLLLLWVVYFFFLR